jgi:hypothetical protein
MSDPNHPKVFLSYASADSESVDRLVDKLRVQGLDVWTDREIAPGQDWLSEIETALDKCSLFVLVMSAAAGVGAWQNVELGMALRSAVGRSQRVIPVILPGTDRDRMPSFLRNHAPIEFDPNNGDQAIESITQAAVASQAK